MPADHPLTAVATNLARSAEDGATRAGASLLGPQGGPDAGRVRRSAFVQYLRDNWADPQFRAEVFARLVPALPNPYAAAPDGTDAELPARNGVAAAEALLKEAFPNGWPEPLPVMGADAGGFAPDPFGGAG